MSLQFPSGRRLGIQADHLNTVRTSGQTTTSFAQTISPDKSLARTDLAEPFLRPAEKGGRGSMSRDIRPDLFDNDLFDLPGKTFGHFHVLQHMAGFGDGI